MPRLFVDGCKTAAIGSSCGSVNHVALNDAGTEDSAISFNSSSTTIYSKHILQADMLYKGIFTGFDKQRFAEQSAKLARIAEEFAIERMSIVTNANPEHGICIVGLCGEFWLHGDGSVEFHKFSFEIVALFNLVGEREELVGSRDSICFIMCVTIVTVDVVDRIVGLLVEPCGIVGISFGI